jgi:hypothetical protein
VAERILDQEFQWRQALGTAGDDILLLQLVEQVGAQPADHAGGTRHADDDHRDDEMLHHRPDLAPGHRLVDVLGIHQATD